MDSLLVTSCVPKHSTFESSWLGFANTAQFIPSCVVLGFRAAWYKEATTVGVSLGQYLSSTNLPFSRSLWNLVILMLVWLRAWSFVVHVWLSLRIRSRSSWLSCLWDRNRGFKEWRAELPAPVFPSSRGCGGCGRSRGQQKCTLLGTEVRASVCWIPSST